MYGIIPAESELSDSAMLITGKFRWQR